MSYAVDRAKSRRVQKQQRMAKRHRRAKRAEVERVLAHVGKLERIASRLSDDAQSRADILEVSRDVLGDLPPIPVAVAASLLGVSEPTVRSWVRRGLLSRAGAQGSGLDVRRLYDVIVLVRDLRDAGQNHDLLNKVWHRLSDNALLERDDLKESLEQMRQGTGIPTDVGRLERKLGLAE